MRRYRSSHRSARRPRRVVARTDSFAVRFRRSGGSAPTGGDKVGRCRTPPVPSPSIVMPGLVPLVSGLTSGRAPRRWARPSPSPRCHPGLVPGSRMSDTAVARLSPDRGPGRAWTPEQVRGDTGRQGRQARACHNPSLDRRCRRPSAPSPHCVMAGLVPAIHVLRHRGVSREPTRRWRDVDARNMSGHDVVGERLDRRDPAPARSHANEPRNRGSKGAEPPAGVTLREARLGRV